ncbi:type IV pilus modification PilV family protein [Desulforamulus ferrireducens]|uniref:Prepilin-type N-terminal cleavage/methylation domain-containing protein n=1 Tax=Desulforamulus ferrireducens TaxID=1833852 RepID=A0A1S6IUM7_9FIRM|nr:prepilin-type N-terminal cleavage/methylation domain-containing protein [Desulforamulus ferrireducens]AQS58478.1 hypothetical protein B0537_04890 [Desulforamulus ferrireducens]
MVNERVRNGFTFIEVMISILILGIVLIPLIDVFARSNINSLDAEKSTTALYLSQSKLEQLINTPFSDIKSVNKQPYPGKDSYTYSVTVLETASDKGYQVKNITVVVYYHLGGVEKQVSLTMEKTNRDVKADQQVQ